MFEKLANISVGLGLLSMGGSILAWMRGNMKDKKAEDKLHDEHTSLMVGLWPPTFFLLALYLFQLQERGYEEEAERMRKELNLETH